MDFTKLKTRKATMADYEAINALSRRALRPSDYVTDYFAGRFRQYLENKRITPFVLTDGNEMLALDTSFIVDGGRTFALLGGRSAPEYRNQGLMRILMQGIMAELRAYGAYPGIERLRSTSTMVKMYEKLEKEGKLVILDKRIVIRCHLKLNRGTMTSPKDNLQMFTEKQFCDAVKNPVTCSKLFPRRFITNNTDVFDAIEENVEDLCFMNDGRYQLVSDNGQLTSISLGAKMYCNDQKSWRYNFNYYGDTCREQLACHIRRHLDHFRSRDGNRDVFFIVMIPDSFAEIFGEQKLSELFVATLSDEHAVESTYQVQQFAVEFVGDEIKHMMGFLSGKL